MAREKDRENPSETSMAYDVMIPSQTKIATALAGTGAMRAAGNIYLPSHEEESAPAYAERLQRAVFLNITELTLNSWVGRPFSDPVVPSEEVDDETLDLLDNIDLLGNNIDVFARNWFRDGVAKAFSHVLVDMSEARDTEVEEGRARTLADDRVENIRPFWMHIKPENLIFAHAEMVDGEERLVHVRILEEVAEMDGFIETVKPQIRVIEPGTVELWQLKETKRKKKKEEWEVVETFEFDLDLVPLVTFYADRTDFMMGKPPLEDLVDLNIQHWQGSSDQEAVLTVARFPMLALSGGTDEDNKLRIGPHQWLFTPDPQGKYYYVEHTGKAIDAGAKDLEKKEEQMSQYGAEFLKRKPGNPTATARALDSAEATSPLQDMTIRFIDSLNAAMNLTAMWLDEEDIGSLSVSTEFGPEELSGDDLNFLTKLKELKVISVKRLLEEAKRRGTLGDDFDDDANEQELEEEEAAMLEMMASMDLDPDDDDNNPGKKKKKPGDEEEDE